jgi:hypothetical protein
LQTSALPLGYGAERDKLASYLQFLNPPRESPKPLPNLCPYHLAMASCEF